jgi:hypothetical protein
MCRHVIPKNAEERNRRDSSGIEVEVEIEGEVKCGNGSEKGDRKDSVSKEKEGINKEGAEEKESGGVNGTENRDEDINKEAANTDVKYDVHKKRFRDWKWSWKNGR